MTRDHLTLSERFEDQLLVCDFFKEDYARMKREKAEKASKKLCEEMIEFYNSYSKEKKDRP